MLSGELIWDVAEGKNVTETSWEAVKLLQERNNHLLHRFTVVEIMDGLTFGIFFEG